MRRRAALLALGALVLAITAASPAAALTAGIPGEPLPASPVAVPTLDADNPAMRGAVYRVPVGAGETLTLSLSPNSGSPMNLDLDLFLYAPGTSAAVHATAIRSSKQAATGYPERISYTPATAGEFYIEVFAYEGTGASVLTWSVAPEPQLPVYRFYNTRTGTHFYTPSAAERDQVIARYPGTFVFEGVAYETKASRNTQALYRFYNKRNGSHFYTASTAERDTIRATLGAAYTYEGESYLVSPAYAPGKTPVYRFYNNRNGSHFYTASEQERASVAERWPGVYSFEGIAFYLGQ